MTLEGVTIGKWGVQTEETRIDFKMEDIVKGEILGKGQYGSVYKAFYTKLDNYIAIKVRLSHVAMVLTIAC